VQRRGNVFTILGIIKPDFRFVLFTKRIGKLIDKRLEIHPFSPSLGKVGRDRS
jgi:hypothetical protein